MPDGEFVTEWYDADLCVHRSESSVKREWFERYDCHGQPHWRRHRDLPSPAVYYMDKRPPVYYVHGVRVHADGKPYAPRPGWFEGWAQH